MTIEIITDTATNTTYEPVTAACLVLTASLWATGLDQDDGQR